MKRHLTIMITLASSFLTAPAFANGTISLRSSVRLAHEGAIVRLADIAELDGETALAHADLVIAQLSGSHAALEISLHDVRAKLEDAGVHWGRTHLSGRSVVVRARRSDVSPPAAMTPVSLDAAAHDVAARERRRPPQALEANSLHEEPTLRGEVARYIVRGLGIEANDLRLTFDERDADLLNTPPGPVRFEIEPASGMRSARIDLVVRLWSDGRITDRRSLSVAPLVRTPTLVVREGVERGGAVRAEHVEAVPQWLPPNAAGVLTNVDDAVGRLATTRLRDGEILRENHVRREQIIRRGEHVTVRCVVGGAVITLPAEARSDGAIGETVEFRKLGERDTFLATITGRGEAVLDLSRR